MDNYILDAHDTDGNYYEFEKRTTELGFLLTLKKENIKAGKSIQALSEFTKVNVGDEGFYAIPRNRTQQGDIITNFDERDDIVFSQSNTVMSFFGFKKKDMCCLIRIERSYLFRFVVEKRGEIYTLSVVFDIENDLIKEGNGTPASDINIEIVFLDKASDFNDIARTEREIRLSRGEIISLRDKCRSEAVEYARKYPLVRIRNGWKPVPTPVLHQTLENEPSMHVACTFKRVRELADEFKAQGIEGAEFQLVGWNIKGHDGRWPQAFPVDEDLGGEAELMRTAEHLKALGYRISLHDNIVDAYEIADCFSEADLTKKKNGELCKCGDWSGGRSYNICPTAQIRNAHERVPKMKALGVNGVHYSDVISLVEPSPCYDEKHPLSFKEALDLTKEVMDYMKDSFGAFSSEGAMDYSIKHIDYALYATFGNAFGDKALPIADKLVNMFEVAYHGIILYNPMSTTINYPIKNPIDRLNLIMRGGKPSIYYYSKFCTNGRVNWMGEKDFTCDGDEDMKMSVSLVKTALDDYEPLRHLQLEYMERYDYLGDGLEVATYSDGTRLVGNFSDNVKIFEDKEIEPFGYVMLK